MSLPFFEWLPQQRWYAGRTRKLVSAEPAVVESLGQDIDLMLVDTAYASGPAERYQVLVKWADEPLAEISAIATIGEDNGRFAYDALFDPASARHLMSLFDSSVIRGEVVFNKEPGVDLPVDAAPKVSSAEQSNTSVIFGKAAMFKAFRRVSAGINPDIELNRVLGRAGNPNAALLMGSYDTTWDGQPCPLGMMAAFAPNSIEGWDMATASARDLYGSDDHGGDSDFSGESRLLGEAVASVHGVLANQLGSSAAKFPVQTALGRLATAAASAPGLASLLPEIEARFTALGGASVTVQRVHGDLHLGQVLRSPQAWLLIDFEGEPGTPLEDRRRPDSALRDVAGMLRSYEYAAYHPLIGTGAEPNDKQLAAAREWIDRNTEAFWDGYAAASGGDPRATRDLLEAYELDKAVYEAGYEARHRPDWLPIPMRSIGRLLG